MFCLLPYSLRDKLAKDDGFDCWLNFALFFINTYKLKPGDSKEMEIIKWKNFVPAKPQAK